MSLPTPKIGDVNVRGYVLPDTCQGDIEALQSIYGFYPADVFNPLLFYALDDINFPPGTEVYFDVVANTSFNASVSAWAANVRRA